jgi:hypothetical protein
MRRVRPPDRVWSFSAAAGWSGRCWQGLVESFTELVPAGFERAYPVVLKLLYDVVVADPNSLECIDDVVGLGIGVMDRVSRDVAVIGDCSQGRFGHSVDDARSDQLDDVAGVWVARVLG